MIAWEIDAQTRRFTRVSGGAQAVLGYPAERWQGVPGFWIGVLHPDDRERVARAVWRALRERKACEIEYRAVASDGSVVRLRDRVRVIRDATGALLLQGSIIDLTERLVIPRAPRRKRGRRWRRFRYDTRSGPLIPPLHPVDRLPDAPIGAPDRSDARTVDQPSPSSHDVVPAPGPSIDAPGPGAGPPPADRTEPVEALPQRNDADSAEGSFDAADWVFPFERELAEFEPVPEPDGVDAGREDVGLETWAVGFDDARILRTIGEAIVASDAEHRIVYWSPASEALLGWTSDDVLGRIDAEVLRSNAPPGQSSTIIGGLIGRRPWTAEVEVQNKDEVLIPVRITASALRVSDDRIVGYVAVVSDLRDARRAESRRSAAASMDAVARLARGVGEELRLGVARIEAAVRSTIARIPAADRTRPGLDEALRHVDSAAALAGQLMAVGRAAPTRPKNVDLRDVVQRSLAAVELLAGPRIEIQWNAGPGDAEVHADPALLSQILLYLVAASTAAVQEGGRIRLAVRTARVGAEEAERRPGLSAGDWVVLEVKDDRLAAILDADRFFEPFSQEGSGIELAAAHGLVNACHGVLIAGLPDDAGLFMQAWFRAARELEG